MLAGTLEPTDSAREPAPVIRLSRKTLLLTDLVGSSTLLCELGDVAGGEMFHGLLSRQAGLVRHLGGQPIKTLGDGLLATFTSPAAAVQAADLIVAAHRRDQWGFSSHPVKARVAVHQGVVGELPGGDVVGREVTLLFELIGHTQPNRAILSGPVAAACERFIATDALPACHLPKSGLSVTPALLDRVREDTGTQLKRIADYWSRMHPGQDVPPWARQNGPALPV